MKKLLLIGFIALTACLGSKADLSWDAPAIDLLTAFGIEGGTWWVQMYQDVDNNTDLSTVTFNSSGVSSDSNDILMTGFDTTTYSNRGSVQFNDTFAAGWETTYGNAYVYTVIFNATSIGAASSSIVFNTSGSLAQLGSSDPFSYTVASTANTWQAVPEPATFALFGIGGVGAWIIRRNKLKSKEEADA